MSVAAMATPPAASKHSLSPGCMACLPNVLLAYHVAGDRRHAYARMTETVALSSFVNLHDRRLILDAKLS